MGERAVWFSREQMERGRVYVWSKRGLGAMMVIMMMMVVVTDFLIECCQTPE